MMFTGAFLGAVGGLILGRSMTNSGAADGSQLVGLAAGTVALTLVGGAAIGALAASSDESGVGPAVAGGILLSGVAGAALGSLVGVLIPKWHRVVDIRTPASGVRQLSR